MSFGVYSQFQTFGQSQELESILKSGNQSLEDLMDRDNFLFDIKAGALGAFIEQQEQIQGSISKRPENLEKMLLYITQTNIVTQNEDDCKNKKYPYIISEIFAIENNTLLEFLFNHHKQESQQSLGPNSYERLTTIEDDIQPEYQVEEQTITEEDYSQDPIISGTSIQYVASFKSKSQQIFNEALRQHLLALFFRFLEADQISETSMGYYSKILTQIMKKYAQDLWEYFLINTNILGDLLRHINHYQIIEMVSKMIVFEQFNIVNYQYNLRFYKERKQLLEVLIIQVEEYRDEPEMICSLCTILINVLEQGNQQKIYEYLRDMYDLLLKPQYFYEIGKSTQIYQLFNLYYQIINFIYSNKIQDQKTAQIIKNIQSFQQVMQNNISTAQGFINTYNQEQSKLFTKSNLYLVKSIDIMIKLKNPLIMESLFQNDILNQQLVYMVQFQWNNQLQNTLQSLYCEIIEDDKYLPRILKNTNLLKILYQYLVQQTQTQNCYKNKKINFGFTSTLKQISYFLVSKLNRSKKGVQILSEIEYISQLLETINLNLEQETQFLCNIDPKTHLEEAPPEISIDRQVEIMLDQIKSKQTQ